MHYGIERLWGLAGIAVLLLACEDPTLAPGGDQPAPASSSSTTLGGPSDLKAAAASPSQVDLAWKDNATNESGFELHRSTAGISGPFTIAAGTGPNVTAFSDRDLTDKKEYCYKVRSFRAAGRKTTYTSFSNTACTTTPGARPGAPMIYVRPVWSFVVIVRWGDSGDNENGYRVDRGPGGAGPWVKVLTTPAMIGLNSQEATDVGLASEVQVCYRVVAFNSIGESPSEVSCTVPPAAPTNLVAKPLSDLSVELTWADNSAFEDGYEVVRATDTQVIVELPAGSTGYRDTGLSGNMTYNYHVRATRDGGTSSPSEIARAPVALLPPAAPTDARASPNGNTSVAVFWTDQSSNDDGFRVERSTDAGVSWMFAVEGQPVSAPWAVLTDSDRTPELEVCYRVIAWNTAGQSSPSNIACTTPPAGPTDLISTQVDAETFELQWTDNSEVEDGYELIAFGSLGDWFLIASLPPNSTSFRYDLSMIPPGYIGPALAATKDGGYSDWVGPSGAEGTAVAQSRIAGRRPQASPGTR